MEVMVNGKELNINIFDDRTCACRRCGDFLWNHSWNHEDERIICLEDADLSNVVAVTHILWGGDY